MAKTDDFNRVIQNIERNQQIINSATQAAKLGTTYLHQIPRELLTQVILIQLQMLKHPFCRPIS